MRLISHLLVMDGDVPNKGMAGLRADEVGQEVEVEEDALQHPHIVI